MIRKDRQQINNSKIEPQVSQSRKGLAFLLEGLGRLWARPINAAGACGVLFCILLAACRVYASEPKYLTASWYSTASLKREGGAR